MGSRARQSRDALKSGSSQNDEEEVLRSFLPSRGRFLDLGAALTFSNTTALADRGWAGVCVEPSPFHVTGLLRRYGENPDVEVVQAAVVPSSPSWAIFWDVRQDLLSTLSSTHRDQREDGRPYRPLHLHTVSLGSLFRRFGYDFDFISIDTEGSSIDLAEALPLGKLPKLKVICVERDRDLRLTGFRTVYETNDNFILAKD